MPTKKIYIDLDAVTSHLKKLGVSQADEEAMVINAKVASLISSYKKRKTIAMEQYAEAKPFSEVYPSIDSLRLPQWVLARISEARVLGGSSNLVIFPDGTKYQLNNPLNDLPASAWLNFTTSVFTTFYSTTGEESYAHHIRKIHPTPKPPQLMKDIISFFTKEGDIVLDYFMGVGGSLLGAGLCGRKAIGIDLNSKYIDAYQEAAKELSLPIFPTVQGDCLEILNDRNKMTALIGDNECSLVLIDPPYGNMMSREKTGGDVQVYGNVGTPFTDDFRDFGNMTIDNCLESLKTSVELSQSYLKKRGYIVIFIKDLQPKKKETNLLHSMIISKINEIPNIQYKGLRIWADKSSKLYPYGYPLSFVANQIHQYILIFRKEM